MKKHQQPNAKIEITRNGPYLISGGFPLSEQWIVTNPEGESLGYREGKKYPEQEQYALCRCGQSGNKPFCDGTHKKIQFDGTETASRNPYREQAETIEGPTMLLTDAESLCAFARLLGPSGLRSVVAESILVKQQLLILNRSRQLSPNLRTSDC